MARSLHAVSGAVMFSIVVEGAVALAAEVTCYVDSDASGGDGTTEATPVASPADIPTDCNVVRFKRGSEFNLASGVDNLGLPSQMTFSTIQVLTNYGDPSLPLPRFVKEHVNGSGGMLQLFGAVTIDGLYLAGSKSGDAMTQLADGIGVMLFGDSKLINSEITLCDIGIMTSGDNVQVLNNYIHDLSISVDAPAGVDPNQVGGAEGIFVNSSHVEVAYNTFINCTSQAEWVTITPDKPRCDGGATEVSVPYAGEVTDVRIHHNISYNSCGFFEIASMPNPDDMDGSQGLPYTKGKFTNSIFHNNVMIDSGWISLLQINNTKLMNVTWANNTIVHHFLPTVQDASGQDIDLNDFGSSYLQAISFNDTSSGVSGGGELSVGDIFWKNNLWYFDQRIVDQYRGALSPIDAANPSSNEFLKNITVTGDKFFSTDPGFVDIAGTTNPSAFDLLASATEVIDQGEVLADITTDFLDRPAPSGAALDLGAFEYQGVSAGGAPGRAGAPGVAGAVGAGGTTSEGAGGTTSEGGGGTTSEGGGATTSESGGGTTSESAGGTTSESGGGTAGGAEAQSIGGQPIASGGQFSGSSAGASADPGQGGDAEDVDEAGTKAESRAGSDDSGCGCRVAARSSRLAAWCALLVLGAGVLRRSRRRQE